VNVLAPAFSEVEVQERAQDILNRFMSNELRRVKYIEYEPPCVGFESSIAESFGYPKDQEELVHQAVEALELMNAIDKNCISKETIATSPGSHGKPYPNFCNTIVAELA